jgi:hypothetical protein
VPLIAALAACSSEKPQAGPASAAGACRPGAEIACVCDNGGTGVQTCREDASGYGECTFCESPEGPADAGDPGFIGNPDDLLHMGCKAVDAPSEPALVEIVVDGSGSMVSVGKWAAATGAAHAFVDALAGRGDAALQAGLIAYGDDADPTHGVGPYPSSRDVTAAALGAQQTRAMHDRLSLTQPSGGAPMQKALEGAYGALEATPNAIDAKKLVVLFSDGTIGSTEDEKLVMQSVTAAAARGVLTLAVGVGPFPADPAEYAAPFLGAIGRAGGAASSACDPAETNDLTKLCQAQVVPGSGSPRALATDLDGAVEVLRREVGSCTYRLPQGATPGKLNVVLLGSGGKKSVLRQSSAWKLDDPIAPKQVTITGASCDALRADRRSSVSYLLECPTAK